jgi:hypothetical protein
LCSDWDTTIVVPIVEEENVNDSEVLASLLSSTTIAIESIIEDIVDNGTEPIIIPTATTTTIINEEKLKHFLTEVNHDLRFY